MSSAAQADPRGFPWRTAAYWGVLGLFLTFGVVSILSIGVFFLAAAAAMIIWALIRRISPRTLPAALVGGGLSPLYVAALHWRGPGMVCSETATTRTCTEYLHPLPFAGVGLALIVVGTVALTLVHRASHRTDA